VAEKLDWDLYARSFVDWAESKTGFYVGRAYNERRREWVKHGRPQPVRFPTTQEKALRFLFTLDGKGRLPVDSLLWIDIGKSFKTGIAAALGQWFGMFIDPPGAEVLLAANAKNQAHVRAYGALRRSVQWNPYAKALAEVYEQEIRFLETEATARAIPLKASTQAGSDAVFIDFDEKWSYGPEAEQFVSEMKPSPTRNISFQMTQTYPGYYGDRGLLNKDIARFFTEDDLPKEDLNRVFEDVPLWIDGRSAIFWNHEPYPWHTEAFLEEQRNDLRPSEFRRIWQAYRTEPSETLFDMRLWDKLTDPDMFPLGPQDRGEIVVLGLDLGIKHDSSAVTVRGYDPETGRYPLRDHRIWKPRPGLEGGELIKAVGQYIIDLHRRHRILGVFYDETQAAFLATLLGDARVPMEAVSQNRGRDEADQLYYDLVMSGVLRNYEGSEDLRRHVGSAVARYTRNGFRIMKQLSTSSIDGCIADVMCCSGVNQLKNRMEALMGGFDDRPKRRNVWSRIYG